MSEECCGADDSRTSPPALRRIERTRPLLIADSCCGGDAAAPEAGSSSKHAGHDHDGATHGRHPELTSPHDEADTNEVRPPLWRDVALLPSVVAGIALLSGYALEWSGAPTPAVVLQSVALVAGAYTFVPAALRRLFRGRLGVGLLMTIAAVGAVFLGHVGEAAALAFLFSLAEALEDRAMDRAKEGLRALLALIPDTVRVSREAGSEVVRTADVRESDVLVVGAGERVATDGIVIEGRSSVDTSAITGESIPVEIGPGDAVAAGSVNGSATMHIRATADGRDNSLTQIVTLVEQAHARKGERARLADRIARPLVPVVLLAAALVAAFGFVIGDPQLWVERALVVLVAASPCALAIAVPVTVISAIGSASKFGVVIKSGEAFERFGTVRTVAFDKTGTLTKNEPQIVEVAVTPAWSREAVVSLAASLEATSTHPLAGAITASSPHIRPAHDVVEEAGRGIAGRVGDTQVRVGNTRWLRPRSLQPQADAMADAGMTVVAVEVSGEIAGLIAIRDELRPEAKETIEMLRRLGVSTVMLTGDNHRTARALAVQAGIAEVHAEQTPKDKADAMVALGAQGPAAMVGDGINDAPALATATVGIAIGTTGAAAAIEAADIAFTGTDLRLVPQAVAHARRGRRIMTANIVLALVIIVVLFPLALFGVLGLAGVVLVHEVAEIIVIANGIRAARRRVSIKAVPATPTAVEPVTAHTTMSS